MLTHSPGGAAAESLFLITVREGLTTEARGKLNSNTHPTFCCQRAVWDYLAAYHPRLESHHGQELLISPTCTGWWEEAASG